MARFRRGDIARLNYRKSKAGRYGENGRLAECVAYFGGGKWEVAERDTNRTRTWLTADMDNVTGVLGAVAEAL